MQQLKNTPITSLPALAQQIRNRIIEVIATRGGHLGASLGVVELTIALHYVFDTPHDILPLFPLSWVWQWHRLWQAIKSNNI